MPRIPTIEIREKIQIKPGETMKLDATVKNHDEKGAAPAVFFCQASGMHAVTQPNNSEPLAPGEKAHFTITLTATGLPAPSLLYVFAFRGDFETPAVARVRVTVK